MGGATSPKLSWDGTTFNLSNSNFTAGIISGSSIYGVAISGGTITGGSLQSVSWDPVTYSGVKIDLDNSVAYFGPTSAGGGFVLLDNGTIETFNVYPTPISYIGHLYKTLNDVQNARFSVFDYTYSVGSITTYKESRLSADTLSFWHNDIDTPSNNYVGSIVGTKGEPSLNGYSPTTVLINTPSININGSLNQKGWISSEYAFFGEKLRAFMSSGGTTYECLFVGDSKREVKIASLIPIVSEMTLGDSSNIWSYLYVTGTRIGTLSVTGTATITGATILGSTLTVTGVTTLKANTFINGTLSVTGTTTGQTFLPDASGTRNLGSTTAPFAELHLYSGINPTGNINTSFFVSLEGGYGNYQTAGTILTGGQVVCYRQSAAVLGAVYATSGGYTNEMPIGVVYGSGGTYASGTRVPIVKMGRTWVRPLNAITASGGFAVFSAGAAGVNLGAANQSATLPVLGDHWCECGHFELNGASNGTPTMATIHFN
jgi:hypothetical protein